MLEILAHASIGRIPATHRFLIADVPAGVTVERHVADALPCGWDGENSSVARGFGDQWLKEARSAILLVPSVVARLEWNALVNPLHPDSPRLVISASKNVVWDKRLFERLPVVDQPPVAQKSALLQKTALWPVFVEAAFVKLDYRDRLIQQW
jgi:RES domain-containing protein